MFASAFIASVPVAVTTLLLDPLVIKSDTSTDIASAATSIPVPAPTFKVTVPDVPPPVNPFPAVTPSISPDPPPELAIQFVPVPVEDNIWPEDPASPDESLIVPATVIFPWKYESSVVVPFLSVIASTSNAYPAVAFSVAPLPIAIGPDVVFNPEWKLTKPWELKFPAAVVS